MEKTAMDKATVKALQQAAGPKNFTQALNQRLLYGGDATSHVFPAQAVLRATDTVQVARIMSVCNNLGLPVTPRGAGSGLTGGALPIAGGIVLDMAGMRRIIAINSANQTALAEPGVVTAHLAQAAEKEGLFYPPDPASANFCTLGGNVAENAGGLRAVKYGVTRDYVLGVKAVLPDGRVFSTGSSAIKSVVGYDLTRLLVGSEGTLAVLTELILRLLPLPEARRTVNGLFKTLAKSTDAVQGVLAGGIRPVAIEFMDRYSLRAADDFAGLGLGPDWEAMILIDIDGPPEVVGRQAKELAAILTDAGGEKVRTARSPEEVEALWAARRALGPATSKLAKGKLNEDIAVPLGNLGEMVARIHRVSRERRLLIPTFGHAGDGNLHVNVMFDPEDPEQAQAARHAVSDIFAHTLALEGTLSGEHGVGTRKLGFVGAEMDPVALSLMRSIKKVFDPNNILNPHKKLPPQEIA